MKPSRSRSNGRLARVRLVVAGRERGQEVEAGHAEGVDHAVRAAREHHVGVAPADHLVGFADRLRAGGAGGQAVGVHARGRRRGWPGAPAGVPGSCSASWIGWSSCSPSRVNVRGSRTLPVVAPCAVHEVDEPGEVLLPLARAEIDAEPGPIEVGLEGLQARVVHGHLGGGDGELGVPAMLAPAAGVVDVLGRGRIRGPRRRSAWGRSAASKRVIGPTPLRPSWSDGPGRAPGRGRPG